MLHSSPRWRIKFHVLSWGWGSKCLHSVGAGIRSKVYVVLFQIALRGPHLQTCIQHEELSLCSPPFMSVKLCSFAWNQCLIHLHSLTYIYVVSDNFPLDYTV
jgi:hypothetical protein